MLAVLVLASACPTISIEPDGGVLAARDGGPVSCSPAPDGSPAGEKWARIRTTEDQPDDFAGAYQIHVIYAEPSDRTAPVQLDVNGSIRRSVNALNTWLASRANGSKFRFDTCNGDLDITYVKLPVTEGEMATGTNAPAFIRDRLEATLAPAFSDPKKLYLVYWDGLTYGRCGGAPLPPDLKGHFTTLNVGGIFLATFLTTAATAGQTTLSVYSTTEMGLPAAPFDATIGTEAIRVTAITATTLTLSTGLLAAHPLRQTVRAKTTIPDCRANPFSNNGTQLTYWEMSAAHECLHPLGIVSKFAADHAAPPTAAGHVGLSAQAQTADLMFQGIEPWGCSGTVPNAAASPCQLDPGHRNYFQLPAGSEAIDLAKSSFLEPSASDASPPPGW